MITLRNKRFVCTENACREPGIYLPDTYKTHQLEWDGTAYCKKHKHVLIELERKQTSLVTAEGTKHDDNKTRVDLLDPESLEAVGEIMKFGAEKYAPYNWQNGIAWHRLYASALRHLFAFWRGQDLDTETKLPHIAHAMACCMMLLWHFLHRKDLDDRPKKA